jgi:2-C-methyl-D-erythritol 2,4-cyclodiphosphate synthase
VPLVLGGVAFDHPRGLAGHSDGDVITHALIDALLGAAGLGDIGGLFPSDDESYRGVSSVDLLKEAYEQVLAAGWRLVNADCVLIGEEPRIASFRDQMRQRLQTALGEGEVNVRATTTDGLGSRAPRVSPRRRSPCSNAASRLSGGRTGTVGRL